MNTIVGFGVADPDPGWVKNQDQDPGSRSGMNNQDHFSESLEAIFWDKIIKFFVADPGSGIRDGKNLDLGSGMENLHPGWKIRIRVPGKTSRIRNTGWIKNITPLNQNL
jgi:hypothetical protein